MSVAINTLVFFVAIISMGEFKNFREKAPNTIFNRSIASNPNSMQSSFGFSVECEADEEILNGLCINTNLPLTPSIKRFLGKAGHNETFPNTIPISGITNRHEADQGEKYKILPYYRSSLDARLYIGSTINWTNYPTTQPKSIPGAGIFSPFISYYDPEYVGYNHKVTKNPFIATSLIHPLIIHNFKEGRTGFDTTTFEKNQAPATYHLDFCHDKSYLGNYNPRVCKAYLNNEKVESEILYGDCYDVTIFSFSEHNFNGVKNEIRTNPVTIFISKAKQYGHMEDITIYPRLDHIEVLPSFEEMRNLANIGEPNKEGVSNLKNLTDFCYSQNPRKAPLYCHFLYKQNRITSINLNGNTKNYPMGPAMFEPSISGDGKLLIVNLGLGHGLHYSYNPEGTCKADGWKNFFPISKMPFDKNIYLNYPIGKAQRKITSFKNYSYVASQPFLDGMGNPIKNGDPVEGAYLWVDRKVRNVFFNAINVVQDQFKGIQNNLCNDSDCMLDAAPGKGLHALGAWTKGKMIHLDSVVNMFDFGYRDLKMNENDQRVFEMNLYKDEVTTLRPSAMTIIGSQENILNYYDALSPLSPFDVVWNLSSNNERTGEIIFDDYLNKDLFLATHFTQATAPYNYNGGKIALFKNGFLPNSNFLSGDSLTKSDFRYQEIPLLQNISNFMGSNSLSSPYFEVLGGARVEPIAQGGVFGKGIFLDGKNDSVATAVHVKNPLSSYLITLWLDPRTLDDKERVIFAFPDYSSIALSKDKFIAKQCVGSSCIKKAISTKLLNLKTNKYLHLGLKLITNNAKSRKLSFYINGTFFNTLDFPLKAGASSFDFYNGGNKGIFSLGRHNLISQEPSFHGWIDELRVYQFENSVIPLMYEEILCNHAYGSLVKIYQTDFKFKSLLSLYNLASQMQLLRGGKKSSALICEQLKLSSYNSGADFADQNINSELICADKVHRNPHKEFSSRCQRNVMYNIHTKQLKAGAPRPSFADVPFCLTCHSDKNNLLSLKNAALFELPINREVDHRRQPLNVPQTLSGCLPDDTTFENFNTDSNCSENKAVYFLDFIFDFKKKIVP